MFSNSIVNEWWNAIDGLKQIDMSSWFATAIKNIHTNESVSELFK